MKQHITRAVAATLICAAYSLYFIFLVKSADLKYLIYIDFLITLCVVADLAYHALKYLKRKSEIKSLLQTDDIIFTELGEFENKDFESSFNDKGILHDFSCPRTPQQNGVVE